jgi:hypothetical protein
MLLNPTYLREQDSTARKKKHEGNKNIHVN